jgi:flagellar hook-length control protein FliK
MAVGMVVNGFLPISDFPLQDGVSAGQNGATAEAAGAQAGDFSALLFLVLGTPQISETPVTGRAEAISVKVSVDRGTDDLSTWTQGTDFFRPDHPIVIPATKLVDSESANAVLASTEEQMGTLGTAFVEGALMQPAGAATQETARSDAHQAKETLPQTGQTEEAQNESNSASLTADSRLWHGAPMQLQEPRRDSVISRSVRPPEEDGKNVVTDAQRGLVKTESLTAAGSKENFSASGLATVGAAETGPQSEFPIHLGGRSMKLPADDTGAERTKAGMAEGEKATQVMGDKMNSRESYAGPQGLAAQGQHGAGLMVSKVAREYASLGEGRQAQGDGGTHSGVLAEAIHSSGETVSANSHQDEQGNFFQQRDHEPTQEPVPAPFEVLWRAGAPIHSARVAESAPQMPTRESGWRPVIDHVAGEINGHIKIGKSEAVIQLDPPELGKLQIELRLDGDKLMARILAEKHESGNLIETHLPELRLALAESRVDHVEVRVDNGSWGGARRDSQQGQGQEAGGGRQPAQDNSGAARNNSEQGEPARRQMTARRAGRVSMWA